MREEYEFRWTLLLQPLMFVTVSHWAGSKLPLYLFSYLLKKPTIVYGSNSGLKTTSWENEALGSQYEFACALLVSNLTLKTKSIYQKLLG